MKLMLTVEQVKEAVAVYVNSQGILTGVVVKPEHVQVNMETHGQYDEAQDVFSGVTIDLAAAKAASTPTQP